MHEDALGVLRSAGIGPESVNPGLPVDIKKWAWLIPAAVRRMGEEMAVLSTARIGEIDAPVQEAEQRIGLWRKQSEDLAAGLPAPAAARVRRGIEQHGSAAEKLAMDMAARRQPAPRLAGQWRDGGSPLTLE